MLILVPVQDVLNQTTLVITRRTRRKERKIGGGGQWMDDGVRELGFGLKNSSVEDFDWAYFTNHLILRSFKPL